MERQNIQELVFEALWIDANRLGVGIDSG